MGKISRGRRKYHTPRKVKNDEDLVQNAEVSSSVPPCRENPGPNIFAGLIIPQEALRQSLEDHQPSVILESSADDTRSVVSKRSLRVEGKLFKKKEKRLLRNEAFLSKLNAMRAAILEAKKRKKRQQTVITGDLMPLLNALPSMDDLGTSNVRSKHSREKPRSVLKVKKRQQKFLEDVAWMIQHSSEVVPFEK